MPKLKQPKKRLSARVDNLSTKELLARVLARPGITTALVRKELLAIFEMLSQNPMLPTLVDEHGRVPGPVYKVLTQLTPMPFVDGFAVRYFEGKLMMGVIERNTDIHAGLLCLIGGKNGQDETYEQSYLYQWLGDLKAKVKLVDGTTWYDPLDCPRYMRRDPTLPDGIMPAGLGWDKGKNSASHVFAVELLINEGDIRFGSKTNDIGQEARKFVWIDPETTDPAKWAYPGMYNSMLRAWRKLLKGLDDGSFHVTRHDQPALAL